MKKLITLLISIAVIIGLAVYLRVNVETEDLFGDTIEAVPDSAYSSAAELEEEPVKSASVLPSPMPAATGSPAPSASPTASPAPTGQPTALPTPTEQPAASPAPTWQTTASSAPTTSPATDSAAEASPSPNAGGSAAMALLPAAAPDTKERAPISAAERRVATLSSLSSYSGGSLYQLDYIADYKLDELLAAGVNNGQELALWLTENVTEGEAITHSGKKPQPGSAFLASGSGGETLIGRNFDAADNLPVVIYTAPEGGLSSVGVADSRFTDINALSGKSAALLAAPYYTVDGVNEKGLFACSLELSDYAPANQQTGKPGIATGMVVRLLLDRAGSISEAVALLSQYDLRGADCVALQYYIADSLGGSAVISYIGNEQNIVYNEKVAANHTLSDLSYDPMVNPDSLGRYLRLRSGLQRAGAKLSGGSAMELLRSAGESGAVGLTSESAVYSLTRRTLNVAAMGRYDNPYEFSLSLGGYNELEYSPAALTGRRQSYDYAGVSLIIPGSFNESGGALIKTLPELSKSGQSFSFSCTDTGEQLSEISVYLNDFPGANNEAAAERSMTLASLKNVGSAFMKPAVWNINGIKWLRYYNEDVGICAMRPALGPDGMYRMLTVSATPSGEGDSATYEDYFKRVLAGVTVADSQPAAG